MFPVRRLFQTQSGVTVRDLHFLRALVDYEREPRRLDLLAMQLKFMRKTPGIPFCMEYRCVGVAVEFDVLDADDYLLADELVRMANTGGCHTVDVIVVHSPATGKSLDLRSPVYSSTRWLLGLEAVLRDLPDDISQWDMQDVHKRLRDQFPEELAAH